MKASFINKLLFLPVCMVMPAAAQELPQKVVAISCAVYSDETGEQLRLQVPELAKLGVNMIVIEIDYSFQWKSHPELSEDYFLSAEEAEKIAKECSVYNICIVPLIDCIGHQSWGNQTNKMLSVYPEFDETQGLYPNNDGIYCRSWCSQNEKVYPILFDLIDEITKAFHTTYFHAGMDEIFLIGEDACPRCRGKDKGELLSNAINKVYEHCVRQKKLTLFIWGDRLLDGNLPSLHGFGEWETSMNGTYTAINSIPKDIIICDWHYDMHDEYPSVAYFIEKGFRVLPASFKDVDAARKLIAYAKQFDDSRKMLGHMYTTWETIPNKKLSTWAPLKKTIAEVK